jgi:hypothetical protein
MLTKNNLNSKILKITMKIKDQYPELLKYIEEISDTIPDEKSHEIKVRHLKKYYDALNSILKKYIKTEYGTPDYYKRKKKELYIDIRNQY